MTEDHSARSTRRPVVLLVDDHPDTRELYSQALIVYGYEPVEASDGFEACDKAIGIVPDVIVTDVGLPRMDGIELTRLLKANGATAHIPIIALTGFGESAVSERGRAIGIVKVLVKPCPPDVLVAAISALCPPGGSAGPGSVNRFGK